MEGWEFHVSTAVSLSVKRLTMFVELENFSVDFGKRRILNSITTTFAGKSVGLLGPNGAGKSTLIKSLLGFVAPAEGTARIMGFDVRREAMKIRQLIGYMPEHEAYIGDLSAVRLLRYMGELSGLPADAAMARRKKPRSGGRKPSVTSHEQQANAPLATTPTSMARAMATRCGRR